MERKDCAVGGYLLKARGYVLRSGTLRLVLSDISVNRGCHLESETRLVLPVDNILLKHEDYLTCETRLVLSVDNCWLQSCPANLVRQQLSMRLLSVDNVAETRGCHLDVEEQDWCCQGG
ncbi:hypothetical protein NPIL_354241 [Nephila pilipes]|uniref:Uncharacterized protein n=1 Tax=Nephila pilipes TaxID=299642 RepID=A0A8X6NF05_NEPPI|nr:hypothetical protein NPIL_354241 [Nephila pilipes]